MSRNTSFYRKIAYLCGIALLFVPISLISAPAASRDEGGGKLSSMRRDYRLSQAQLGKIDPASASMSLATLGMRGVAANLLWGKAIDAKKKEDWDVLKATLNQITKLQPNFVSVWQFQAWNISYNVSVEFDDFRHRYHWVKKGIDYLLEGTDYNQNEPLLLWDAGWFFGHKMGRADEYKQFRRLFREDNDFHTELPVDLNEVQGPDGKPDNWLCARWFFLDAQRAADKGARIKRLATYYWMGNQRVIGKKQTPLRGKNPLIFHSDPPKALINYADAISEEGYLDEVSKLAWQKAGREWSAYGDREIITSDGTSIHLNDLERAVAEMTSAATRVTELCKDVREQIEAERRAGLTDEQREALGTPLPERSAEQRRLANAAKAALQVTLMDLAERAPKDVKEEALALAARGMKNADLADWVERYREIVNYTYWATRCEAEQQDNTIAARRDLLDAQQAFADTDLEGARQKFEAAWERWAVVFDKYPVLVDDVEGEDVMDAVLEYVKLLGQLDEPFRPQEFKLKQLLVAYQDEYPELLDGLAVDEPLEPQGSATSSEPVEEDSTPNERPVVPPAGNETDSPPTEMAEQELQEVPNGDASLEATRTESDERESEDTRDREPKPAAPQAPAEAAMDDGVLDDEDEQETGDVEETESDPQG